MVIVLTSEVIEFECGTRHFVKWEKRQFLIVKCGTGTDGHQWNEWKKVTSNEIQNFGKYIVVATKVIFCFYYFFFYKLFNVKKSPKEEENKNIQTSNIYPRPNIENQNYLLSVCTWVWEEGMYKWVAKRNIVRKNNCSLRMHNTKK